MFTTKPVRNGTHSRPDKRQYHDDFPEVIEPFAEADTRPTKQPRGGYCLLYTSPSPRDRTRSRMPSSA